MKRLLRYLIVNAVNLASGYFEKGVRGRENIPRDRNFIVVANHRSYFDNFILFPRIYLATGKYPVVLAKAEYQDRVLTRLWGGLWNTIPVRRTDKASNILRDTLATASNRLKQGEIVNLYPEGTRNREPGVGKFKPGAVWLATETGCDILPVAIAGSDTILPPGRLLPNPAGAFSMVIGKPYSPPDRSKASSRELHATIEHLYRIAETDLAGTFDTGRVPSHAGQDG